MDLPPQQHSHYWCVEYAVALIQQPQERKKRKKKKKQNSTATVHITFSVHGNDLLLGGHEIHTVYGESVGFLTVGQKLFDQKTTKNGDKTSHKVLKTRDKLLNGAIIATVLHYRVMYAASMRSKFLFAFVLTFLRDY